jgi:beta-N-acetylhexosaminidase
MSILDSLRLKPFNLDDAAIAWVEKTRASLSLEDTVRQLFVQISMGDDPAMIDGIVAERLGGVHRFMGNDVEASWSATRRVLENSAIPPFITGDLEGGGMAPSTFTDMQNQLGLAAANDLDLSRRSLEVMVSESKGFGYNWSFTPVVDINKSFQSAVVGTRSYGSDVDTIISQAVTHVEVLQANGFAATAKHWPGEGLDQRDQHLVTTINPLSVDEWEASFGRIYRAMIDAGVMSVMSAHIAFPAWMERAGVPESVERYRPASVSHTLNEGLLRGHLGFNGLIISDATPMAGLGSWADAQSNAVDIIRNGCDVFLFSDDFQRDCAAVIAACQDGRISAERLEAAITRTLGLKAALGLHTKSLDERMPPLGMVRDNLRKPESLALSRKTTSKSICLVKDVRHTLPLNPTKHKRVVLIDHGTSPMLPFMQVEKLKVLTDALVKRGFEVRAYDPDHMPTAENTDLLLYTFAVESSLIKSRIFIDWKREHGGFHQAMTRFWHEIPTVMISFGHPYYLFDAPRVPTYINAWSILDDAQDAVVRKLCGNEPFEGVSPVDAFCGLPDAKY